MLPGGQSAWPWDSGPLSIALTAPAARWVMGLLSMLSVILGCSSKFQDGLFSPSVESVLAPLQRPGRGPVMAEEHFLLAQPLLPFLSQQRRKHSPESVAVPGSGTHLAPGWQCQQLQGQCTPSPSLGARSCLLLGTPHQCWACGRALWLPHPLPAPP